MTDRKLVPVASTLSIGLLVQGMLIVALAAAVRCLLYAGPFGSDEVTYLGGASEVLAGIWSKSSYIGSLRYGVNIPMAGGLAIFGQNAYGAAAWGFASSLLEIGVIFALADRLWGRKVAIFSALFLAFLPLHVHFATRMMADPPLALFISLAMLFIALAESSSKNALYLLAGLSLGATYWIKDAGFYVMGMVMFLYAVIYRRWHLKWLYLALGAAIAVGLNMLLMWSVQGDPLHLQHAGALSLNRLPGQATDVNSTSPLHYLNYLLFDLRHTWILFPLALLGLLKGAENNYPSESIKNGRGLVLVWLLASILILSALPLRQSNYILMFAGPLSILAAVGFSQLRKSWALLVLAVYLAGALVLAALQQQAIHTFTANSRAVVQFASNHPAAVIYAPTGAFRMDIYDDEFDRKARPKIKSLAEFDESYVGGSLATPSPEVPIFVVRDLQTEMWGDPLDARWGERSKRACLSKYEELVPAGLGNGRIVVDTLNGFAKALPIGSRGQAIVEKQFKIKTATVYRFDPVCYARR